uniref:Transposase n=1 Tax=Globodera pallida TaxID=36090 RepID=A0A183CFN5_GLOPA
MSKYDKIGVLMLNLLDNCLFGKKVCLIDELIIYYVEHL